MVQGQIRTGDGVLTSRQKGLNSSITLMDTQMAAMQRASSARTGQAVHRWTASGLKATGSYLTAQLNSMSSSSSG
jgi:hypothetical protein